MRSQVVYRLCSWRQW